MDYVQDLLLTHPADLPRDITDRIDPTASIFCDSISVVLEEQIIEKLFLKIRNEAK